jgi:hypothetical protein
MREKGWRKLYGNRLLVKPDAVFVSSIIATPDSVIAPRAESGVIVEIGHQIDASQFWVNQRITFTPHAGVTANLKDESLMLMTPSEVVFWVKPTEDQEEDFDVPAE